ncbi:hypothetical protein M5K25_016463 [Dendrobium thyrsiflorum]|uniref:Uncharacterized protein n=1 Tax=Dendrobium thyrsiflorum TaxID=117978 RepID=A0ABD0US26_DENTH
MMMQKRVLEDAHNSRNDVSWWIGEIARGYSVAVKDIERGFIGERLAFMRLSAGLGARAQGQESTIMSTRFPIIPNSPNSALSLLSSNATPWASPPELSSRSSAALRELIAENRATLFAKQLFSDRSSFPFLNQTSCSSLSYDPHQHQFPFQIPAQVTNLQGSGNHLTLDLMQIPSSSVDEFLSGRNKSKDEDEDCCEIWKSLEAHVV